MVAERLKKHSVSFRCAFQGVSYALKTQPNFAVHFFLAAGAAGLGLFYEISRFEWLVLVLTVSGVLAAEMLNTAVEIVTDALKVHKRTEADDFYIMAAKDVAAGAVLFSAIAAVIVGLVIFGPRLLSSLSISI